MGQLQRLAQLRLQGPFNNAIELARRQAGLNKEKIFLVPFTLSPAPSQLANNPKFRTIRILSYIRQEAPQSAQHRAKDVDGSTNALVIVGNCSDCVSLY